MESHDLNHKRQQADTSDVRHTAKRPCNDLLCNGSLSECLCKDDSQVGCSTANETGDPVLEKEMVLTVMKTLGEEIDGNSCTEEHSSCDGSQESLQKPEFVANSSTHSVTGSNRYSESDDGCSQVDIENLMGVGDDELGLPPTPHSLEGNDDTFPNLPSGPEVEELLQQYTADFWAEQSINLVPYDIGTFESPPGVL